MAAILRATDVLGGIVGGFPPLVPFAGWRVYGVTTTYTDPAGVEFPAFRMQQLSGPFADTIAQVATRCASGFVDRSWPYPAAALAKGSHPDLAWYLMDTSFNLVAGPLLPIGNTQWNQAFQNGAANVAPITENILQWYSHTVPITGPYIGILVSREPTAEFPLFVAGHPVEIVTALLTRKGETYDATSATDTIAAMGEHLAHISPITAGDASVQNEIDRLAAAYGFAVRRSGASGTAEFVYWRDKVGNPMPTPVLDSNTIRAEGGPTFDLSDATRVTRVRATGQVMSKWVQGKRTEVKVQQHLAGPPTIRYKTVPAIDNEKPASGLLLTSADVVFDYSTDGVTPDSELYGEQEVGIEFSGMPAVVIDVNGTPGFFPLNLSQFSEGAARMVFDGHSRGRQMLTAVGIRGTDFDDALLGEAVTVAIEHVPSARIGRTPTSQRIVTSGDQRPFRVVERSEEVPGPVCTMADEGTGVPLAITLTLQLLSDTTAEGNENMRVVISPADDLAAAGAQVEFQVRLFPDGDPITVSDPGFRYTVVDATPWTDEPHTVRLGDFPPDHQVVIRARAWLIGGGPGDWSSWYTRGGPITGPQTTLSNLLISNVTDVGADLDWSYDESPPVGSVKVQYRDETGGVIGSYSTFSTLAAGTETETLTGLTAGHAYGVRLVLIDGGSVEYGDILIGSFVATGGKISGLGHSSVTATEAKLTWTNTDGGRQVLVEYRVTGDPLYQTFAILPATSNRIRLTGLQPTTAYDVRVSIYIPISTPGSLLAGVAVGDGAGGPALTDSFTTAAVTVTLEFPLMGGAFAAWDPNTALRYDGRFGCRLHANPNNTVPHTIVVLLAVETAIGSGTPGAFVEQSPALPATQGVDLWFIQDAPNDGKLRYMKAISRATGYTDSIETVEVEADPWPSGGPQPPIGGGIPNTYTIPDSTGISLASGAHSTGAIVIPDGAEVFRVESPLSKDIRLRLYTNSTVQTSDQSRAVTSSLWPAGLLFDATILSTDSYLIDIDPVQRFRLVLSNHEDRKLWYTLTNLEVGTEVVNARIYYFASPATGTLL